MAAHLEQNFMQVSKLAGWSKRSKTQKIKMSKNKLAAH
jgi:hypothetical protein